MACIWEAYADEIALMAERGTPKASWDRATDPEYIRRVTDESEFQAILKPYEDISDEERDSFMQLFQSSWSTVHYRLEGNFKALVFFDGKGLTIDAVVMSN